VGIPLFIIGLLMVITGERGTYSQFGSQVASEFQGQNNFTYWLLAIGMLGAIGYYSPLQKISRMLMALVILVIFLANKGFFAKFQQALQTGPTSPNALPQSATTTPSQAVSQATGAVLAPAAQATGAGTVNQWLQSLPGVGQYFNPQGPSWLSSIGNAIAPPAQ
jgi:hypothetical protein